MRLLEAVAPATYSDPWNRPVATRWAQLWSGAPRIAYVYESPDNSTFRYRAYNMVQALRMGTENVGAAYFFLSELSMNDLAHLADAADIVVLCRVRYDCKVAMLADSLARKNKPMFFDVDDLVFSPRHIPVVMQTLGHAHDCGQTLDSWYARVGRLKASLDLCSGAVATNDFLAARIREEHNVPVAIVPNFMNMEQLEMSARLVDAKEKLAENGTDKVWLGYFSGTPTHNRDFELLSYGLGQAMKDDARIHLAIVGYLDLPPALVPFESRVTRFPFQDFVNLQRLIASVDVNLMPLQVNTFTNCKSELKYFEAAAVATPSIASPSHTYANAIIPGETGFIAASHEWKDVVQKVLAEPDKTCQVAQNAFRDVLKKYSPETWGNEIFRRLQAAFDGGEGRKENEEEKFWDVLTVRSARCWRQLGTPVVKG
ncbi:MAG: glycosyltransferase [Desulfovibrio sp.]|uniref:glycosyltransferase n=1 Tax=Desulfovibrio sp. 7SRBS1 TaxID=3378064 RepID=UPI003B3EA57B